MCQHNDTEDEVFVKKSRVPDTLRPCDLSERYIFFANDFVRLHLRSRRRKSRVHLRTMCGIALSRGGKKLSLSRAARRKFKTFLWGWIGAGDTRGACRCVALPIRFAAVIEITSSVRRCHFPERTLRRFASVFPSFFAIGGTSKTLATTTSRVNSLA